MVCPCAGRDTDEVEAAGPAPRIVGFKPCLGGAAEAFLLGGGESFKGAFKAAFGAGLHFHKNKGSLFLGHDIQLKLAGAPVAVEYIPSKAGKVGCGRLLTFCPGSGLGRARPWGRLFFRILPGKAPQEIQHSQPCSCFLGRRTPRKSRRCRGQGPYLARASRCSFVP